MKGRKQIHKLDRYNYVIEPTHTHTHKDSAYSKFNKIKNRIKPCPGDKY